MYTDQSKSSRYSQTCLSSNLKLGAFSKANQEQEFARPAITIWFPRLENFENEMAAMLEHDKMTLKDLLLFTITVTVYTRQSQESLSPKKKKKKDQVNSKGLLQEQQYWNHKTKKSYKRQMAAQAQQSTALLRKPPNTMQHIVHDSNFTIKNHVV